MPSRLLELALRRPALTALFAWFALAIFAHAQDSAFTFRGQLEDNGAPATGTYDLRFTLFDTADGGNAVGTAVALPAVTVSAGAFAVTLDFGVVVFDGSQRFLQTEVRPVGSANYTLLSPRQPITSVPYAIRAATFNGTVTSSMLAPGSVRTEALANGAVTLAKLAGTRGTTVSADWTSTINQGMSYYFGEELARLGSDRIVAGSDGDDLGNGIVEISTFEGSLLTVITNPAPSIDMDHFGQSLATLGSDLIAVGAHGRGDGVVYLYRPDGTLVRTLTNTVPEPAGTRTSFGIWLQAVGADRLLIANIRGIAQSASAEVVFLYHINGTLLTTFTSPLGPGRRDYFGSAMSSLGSDLVAIGGQTTETVWVFHTSGTLIASIPSPEPGQASRFGSALAAGADEKLVIGAPNFGNFVGRAYLYSAHGNRLATFESPWPGSDFQFGYAAAAVTSGEFAISARTRGNFWWDLGTVTFFDPNGTAVASFDHPDPPSATTFGSDLVPLAGGRLAVGAASDWDTPGHVYVLNPPGETYVAGLVADSVRQGAIGTSHLGARAVTADKLDPSLGVWSRAGDDVFRADGRVGVGTSTLGENRLEVAGAVGATAFNTTSDRAAKQGFAAVDPSTILEKVEALPITRWSFKDQPAVPHVGPTAQDFHAAFGLGQNEKSIATVDADGVALAAIQGLNRKLEDRLREKERELEALRQALDLLRTEIEALKR